MSLNVRLALVFCLLAAGCQSASGRPEGKGDKPAEPPRPVRVVQSTRGGLPRVVTVSGTLGAEQEAELGMKTAGRLGELNVDLGSRVERGQALASLEPADFRLRVRQAEALLQQSRVRLGLPPEGQSDQVDLEKISIVRQAQALLAEATIQRDRARELSKKQLMPRSELDSAEAAYQVADGRYHDAREEAQSRQAQLAQRRFELELARQQLTDSTLLAPFAGAVRERRAVPGQFVTAGQPIVTLVQTDPLRLRLAIPEREAVAVRAGQEVSLTVSGDPAGYTGHVARLSPAIEEKSRTLMVEVEVPNPSGALRPGAFATARIVTSAEEPVVLAPASAVTSFAGIEKLILAKEGKAVEKRVRTGRRSADSVEILEGLDAGEPVVAEPGNLVGGQAVSIQQ